MAKPDRKQMILETLARELEHHPGGRITMAALAREVGISEASLYRQFASKALMFESLISFAEETVFARINVIFKEQKGTEVRCQQLLYLVLGFADRNPGIARVLLGDVLIGERDRLVERVQQFFERIELQFRQVLREAALRLDVTLAIEPEAAASLLTAYIEGRLHQFQRHAFNQPCLERWSSDWELLRAGLFTPDQLASKPVSQSH